MSEPNVPVTQAPTCYRHPDRSAGVRCQRCERPICPSCMVQASVGFQCPECVKASAKSSPTMSARSLLESRPNATYVLIALNVVVFIAELATMASATDVLYGASGSVAEHLVLFAPSVGDGEWYRMITAGFLHAGLIHIGMNMFVLWRIGPQLERLLGWPRYVSLYLAALLAGSLGAMVVSPDVPTLGASGAIFGLLGAALAYQLSHRINVWQSGLGGLIVLNLVVTFALNSYISVGAHVGGLVGGALTGYLVFQLDQRRQSPWVGVAVSLALAAAFFAAGVVLAPSLSGLT
jgi:membrane associated rhomboid family serine protease